MANPQTVSDVRALLRAGLAAVRGQGFRPAPVVLPTPAPPDAAQQVSPAEAESPVVPSASGKPVTKRVPGRRKKGSAS